jgi:hypothetical protein
MVLICCNVILYKSTKDRSTVSATALDVLEVHIVLLAPALHTG